ncbi:uncharacterized protein LOC109842828 [Asparagus officinalis]|uniref:uncharacterized protein LOC109842828 n=1 Tax=Asparagus officinalis TaxID=4686 RepID=UPI00098E45C9|nr:uncharacterized protein LOC109842828 [Asparagus officinalis]
MEGLIPYIYKAIVQYRNNDQPQVTVIQFDEVPSASYVRLPGNSGRFRMPDVQFFASSPPSSPEPLKQPKGSQVL